MLQDSNRVRHASRAKKTRRASRRPIGAGSCLIKSTCEAKCRELQRKTMCGNGDTLGRNEVKQEPSYPSELLPDRRVKTNRGRLRFFIIRRQTDRNRNSDDCTVKQKAFQKTAARECRRQTCSMSAWARGMTRYVKV